MSFIWHKSQAKSSKVLFLDKLCKFDKLVVDIIDKLSVYHVTWNLLCWNVGGMFGMVRVTSRYPGTKLVYRLRDIMRAVSQDRRQVAARDGVMRSYNLVTSWGEWRM